MDDIIESQAMTNYLLEKHSKKHKFGIAGVDALAPACSFLIREAAAHGIDDLLVTMPHRGRTVVLTHCLKMPVTDLFKQLSDKNVIDGNIHDFKDDVQAHMQYKGKVSAREREVGVELLANPSHLEITGSVGMGKTNKSGGLLLQMHGDAAFCGLGVNYELLQMEGLDLYDVGGHIKVIVNNQLGFTTNPESGRSTEQVSDLMKIGDALIIHVNGDHPEEVCRAFELALQYRQRFGKTACINLVGYRLKGHNEGDNPEFTQPLMYREIKSKKPMWRMYSEQLVAERLISPEHAERELRRHQSVIEQREAEAKSQTTRDLYNREQALETVKLDQPTGVDIETLKSIGDEIFAIPPNFSVNKTFASITTKRAKSVRSGKSIDFATAELLALASVEREGFGVRFTGEDCERGTFSSRHSLLVDTETNEELNILNRNSDRNIRISNTLLNEQSVLGFEYGYSLNNFEDLVLWEAQFGDFVNMAQVVIDQYIMSGMSKWGYQSGLTLLLPHGSDGLGPDHSNCRLERFLQGVNDDHREYASGRYDARLALFKANAVVCNVSTAANYFHVLRRQVKRDYRRPLIIASPKKLLMHKMAKSDLVDFGSGSEFRPIIDGGSRDRSGIERVIFCSGQLFLDLEQKRVELGAEGTVDIVRIEQLAPFPYSQFELLMRQY